MEVRHPIDAIPSGSLRFWQAPSLIVAAVLMASLPIVLTPRANDTLVDLVEARTVPRAEAVLAQWSSNDRIRAAYVVGFDFLMNPAYMNVLAISAVWAGRTFRARRAVVLASVLAWLAWSVIVTNVVENVGLFVALSGDLEQPWPLLMSAAHYWASAVIMSVLLFVAAGVFNRMRRAA